MIFEELVHFVYIIKFVCIEFKIICYIYALTSYNNICPVLFLLLLISIFFIVRFARHMSIFLIFSKNQVFVSLVFLQGFVFNFILLLSLLFPSACFGPVLFLTFRFLRWEFRLLIWHFSSFLICEYSALSFLVDSVLTLSHKFWYALFSFSSISVYFYFLWDVLLWLMSFFRTVLFSLHMFGILNFFNSCTMY